MNRYWDIVLDEFPHTSNHGIHIALKLSFKMASVEKNSVRAIVLLLPPARPLWLSYHCIPPSNLASVCIIPKTCVYDLVLGLSFSHLNPHEKKIRGTNSWRNRVCCLLSDWLPGTHLACHICLCPWTQRPVFITSIELVIWPILLSLKLRAIIQTRFSVCWNIINNTKAFGRPVVLSAVFLPWIQQIPISSSQERDRKSLAYWNRELLAAEKDTSHSFSVLTRSFFSIERYSLLSFSNAFWLLHKDLSHCNS